MLPAEIDLSAIAKVLVPALNDVDSEVRVASLNALGVTAGLGLNRTAAGANRCTDRFVRSLSSGSRQRGSAAFDTQPRPVAADALSALESMKTRPFERLPRED